MFTIVWFELSMGDVLMLCLIEARISCHVCVPLPQVPVSDPFSCLKSKILPTFFPLSERSYIPNFAPVSVNFYVYVNSPSTCVKIWFSPVNLCWLDYYSSDKNLVGERESNFLAPFPFRVNIYLSLSLTRVWDFQELVLSSINYF